MPSWILKIHVFKLYLHPQWLLYIMVLTILISYWPLCYMYRLSYYLQMKDMTQIFHCRTCLVLPEVPAVFYSHTHFHASTLSPQSLVFSCLPYYFFFFQGIHADFVIDPDAFVGVSVVYLYVSSHIRKCGLCRDWIALVFPCVVSYYSGVLVWFPYAHMDQSEMGPQAICHQNLVRAHMILRQKGPRCWLISKPDVWQMWGKKINKKAVKPGNVWLSFFFLVPEAQMVIEIFDF